MVQLLIFAQLWKVTRRSYDFMELCRLVDEHKYLAVHTASFSYLDDGGNMFLRNAGIKLPDYTVPSKVTLWIYCLVFLSEKFALSECVYTAKFWPKFKSISNRLTKTSIYLEPSVFTRLWVGILGMTIIVNRMKVMSYYLLIVNVLIFLSNH